MDIEGKTIAWLTADEVAIAVRTFVRERGQPVSSFAVVNGLGDLTDAKHAVSVVVRQSSEEVT